MSAGRSTRPAVSAFSPSARSSPARRRLSPGRTAPAGTTMRSPSWRTNSCGITVSSPSGMTAPVMMRTHWPGPTVPW
ncbi:Uncharacterised protein [Bordetella pertussis]|nr:Uncharacterised protein [Bordetella pertussis]